MRSVAASAVSTRRWSRPATFPTHCPRCHLPTAPAAACVRPACDGRYDGHPGGDQSGGSAGRPAPVVHLPMGAYKIDRTLVIPRQCDLQIMGAAPRGRHAGCVGRSCRQHGLRVEGPCRATIRDLQIQSGASSAMLVETPDDADARIFANQLNADGPTGQPQSHSTALRVAGFERAGLQFRDFARERQPRRVGRGRRPRQ